jgi:hypothetical protein
MTLKEKLPIPVSFSSNCIYDILKNKYKLQMLQLLVGHTLAPKTADIKY